MNTVILLLESFTACLRREEKSPFTVEQYVRDVRVFMTFVGERTLSKELVMDHKAKLLASGYAKGSVNYILASINSFLKFIERPDCRVANVRVQRRLYCPEEKKLDKAEYMRLRVAAKRRPRLYLILETLFSTGIRISELKYFTVEALQQKTVNVSCKNKTRTIIVPKELRKRLLEYAGKTAFSPA